MKPIFSRILLIINILLWTLLLLAIISPFIPPDVFMPSAFLALAYGWIWLATVFFTLLFLFFRPKLSLIGFAVVALGVPFALKHVAFSGDDGKPRSAFRVLSFNACGLSARYGDDEKDRMLADSITSFLASTDSDIVCIQEFTTTVSNLNAYVNMFARTINTHLYHFQKYKTASGRFHRDFYLVTATKHLIVGEGVIENEFDRFGMYTDILIYPDTIRVFNLHLKSTQVNANDIAFLNNLLNETDHTEKSMRLYRKMGKSFCDRALQAQQIEQIIAQSPYPVIVCGDFNDTPASYARTKISNNLTDSFLESGNGFGETYNGKLPLMRIDYILHDENFQTADFQVHHNRYSDHYPVSVHCYIQK